MSAGHGSEERSYSTRIRLSPEPETGVPSISVLELPLFTVAWELIVTSGTAGITPVSLNNVPR